MTTCPPIAPIRYDGKVVIVTGASRGIGRTLAHGFSAAGAHTIAVARRADELDALVAEIEAAGGAATAVPADCSRPEGVEKMTADALAEHGRIDVLMNNLGIAGPTAPVENTSLEDWQTTIAVNLTSVFLAVRAVVPAMKIAGGGSIINLGSVLGKIAVPYRSAYAATKMGLIGMSRVLAYELGSAGIRVNTIVPGFVAGERSQEVMASQAEHRNLPIEEIRAQLVDSSPLKTQVTSQSILNVALFLASDHAAHMTGQDINVSAGFVLH